jgi:hypothetical protein
MTQSTAELRRSDFRNPMLVLMDREEMELRRTCLGCKHAKAVISPFDDEMMRCQRGKPYGIKCHLYEVGNE